MRFRGTELDIIEIIVGLVMIPLISFSLIFFFSTIENQVDKIDKLLSEFDIVCRKA